MSSAGVVSSFLIVDDDKWFARSAARQYRSFGDTQFVSSLSEAAAAIRAVRWTGVVLDVCFPEGSGLEFLAAVRRVPRSRDWLRSVVICSGLPNEDRLRAQCQSLEADFIPKGAEAESHTRFARRAIAAEYVRSDAAIEVATLAQHYELSAMQTRVLALQVAAVPRDEWSSLLGGMTSNTIRTHVKRVCKTANVSSLSALATPITSGVMRRGAPLH